MHHLIFLVFTLFWWALFVFCFVRDTIIDLVMKGW